MSGEVWARIHHDSPLTEEHHNMISQAITISPTSQELGERNFDTISWKDLEDEIIDIEEETLMEINRRNSLEFLSRRMSLLNVDVISGWHV